MGKTSWQVKAKYNSQNYKSVCVQLDKVLVANWEKALAEEGLTKAQFIRQAIQSYLESKAGN